MTHGAVPGSPVKSFAGAQHRRSGQGVGRTGLGLWLIHICICIYIYICNTISIYVIQYIYIYNIISYVCIQFYTDSGAPFNVEQWRFTVNMAIEW